MQIFVIKIKGGNFSPFYLFFFFTEGITSRTTRAVAPATVFALFFANERENRNAQHERARTYDK